MHNWTVEQKEAIMKDGQNIIVSAGAGSGKTAVLTERVLRKLNEGININELLILTFTKNAASEMKERIKEKIKENKNLTSQLQLIDSAYITTFDSYALSVVKKYHYLLNMSPNVKIADENLIKLQKEKIIDEIFEDLYKKNDFNFIKLINDFTMKDDKEIREYILNISSKVDMIIDKNEYLSNYVDKYFCEDFIKGNLKEFLDIVKDKISKIEKYLELARYYCDKTFYDKLSFALLPLLNSKNYDEIFCNCKIKLPSLPKNSEPELKKIKEEITVIIKEINSICKYNNETSFYNEIYSTKPYIKIIIEIIEKLNIKITNFKYENNVFEFNDIAILSIQLLEKNENIKNDIKNGFKEIMIDEYQDTNDLQEIFINSISKNNVYMVGDIKQSIYRFRNANPSIFKNKYDNFSNNNGGYKIDLNKNFRSRSEVLDNINKIFDIIMDNSIGGAYYKNSHRMIFGNESYNKEGNTNQNYNFEIYNYNFDKNSLFSKEEYEIFIIANDIKNKVNSNHKVFDKDNLLLRDAKYNDFVILMDRTVNFDLYKKIFEYMNIPLSILKDENISSEISLLVIKNMISLVNKIYKEEFDLKFNHLLISVLRSPFVQYDDNKIFELLNNNFKNDIYYMKLKEISKNIPNFTSSELIKELIKEFNIYEKIIEIGDVNSNIEIIKYILEISNNLSELGYDIEEFINYLENVIEKNYEIKFSSNLESSNSVKIMSIHKSKGLEYNICYYSGLYKDFNISDLKDKIMFDNKYGIITPIFNEGIDDTFYKYLVKQNYFKDEISEKLRLFYVALTRAKEKMILVCDINEETVSSFKNEDGILDDNIRLSFRSFNDILISIKNDITKYIKNIEVNNLTKDYDYIQSINIKDKLNNNLKKFEIDEIDTKDSQINEKSFSKNIEKLNSDINLKNIGFGTYMHYIMEVIDFKNKDISFIPDEKYKQKIMKFLNNSIFKNIKSANIYKEYEFMYKDEDSVYHGIIDLMVEYEEYIDIVDYKLKNIDNYAYKEQLMGYKNYIEQKTRKKVNTYLYSILDEKLRKID